MSELNLPELITREQIIEAMAILGLDATKMRSIRINSQFVTFTVIPTNGIEVRTMMEIGKPRLH